MAPKVWMFGPTIGVVFARARVNRQHQHTLSHTIRVWEMEEMCDVATGKKVKESPQAFIFFYSALCRPTNRPKPGTTIHIHRRNPATFGLPACFGAHTTSNGFSALFFHFSFLYVSVSLPHFLFSFSFAKWIQNLVYIFHFVRRRLGRQKAAKYRRIVRSFVAPPQNSLLRKSVFIINETKFTWIHIATVSTICIAIYILRLRCVRRTLGHLNFHLIWMN